MATPTNKNVLVDRIHRLGGSEIPSIMGISPFKTRWQLLQEKAGIIEPEVVDNKFVDYGMEMEKYIRDYVNFLDEYREDMFSEDSLVIPDNIIDTSCNVDGRNSDTILEIKTTSRIYDNLDDYKLYLVQLLYYMYNFKYEKGLLAVYRRPEDFSTDFDPEQLMLYNVNIGDYKDLVEEIRNAVSKFRVDLLKLKENPNLQESDFVPAEIVNYANEIQVIENKLKTYKQLEKEQEELKTKLYESMLEAGIKTWTTPNNTKITLVEEIPSTTIIEEKFDEETFKKENEEEYNKYIKQVEKKKSARKGYIKISIKEEK